MPGEHLVCADGRSPDRAPSPSWGPSPDNGDSLPPLLRQLTSGSLFGIRPGEGSTAWLLFGYFFLLATIHYVGKSVRDSTYVASLGATQLPFAYLLAHATGLGPTGVFIAITVAESLIAVVGMLVFRRGRWKLRQV